MPSFVEIGGMELKGRFYMLSMYFRYNLPLEKGIAILFESPSCPLLSLVEIFLHVVILDKKI